MTKPNPENCKNCSSKCAYHCVQLSYTTQHGAVLIIFPLNLQASITAQILSTGGEGPVGQQTHGSSCPRESLLPDGISIGSAAFARLARMMNTHRQTHRPRYVTMSAAIARIEHRSQCWRCGLTTSSFRMEISYTLYRICSGRRIDLMQRFFISKIRSQLKYTSE